MTNIYLIISITLLSLWIISGFLSYGFSFAILQKRRDFITIKKCYKTDMFVSFIYSIGGLISLAIIIAEKKYKYGFKII